MRGYLGRSLRAQVRAGRALFLLSLLGVALGVAAVLSVQILNQNALGAFAGSVRAVSGDAQISVLPRAPKLPESLLPRILAERGVAAAAPLVRLDAALAGPSAGFLEIVATDLFAGGHAGQELDRAGDPLGTRGWVAISPALAREMGWKRGDRFEVSIGSRRAVLVVGAILDLQRKNPLASHRLALMDIAEAQDLSGQAGRVQEIAVTIRAGFESAELARRLGSHLGPETRVVTAEERRADAAGLLSAFRLNLTALSLVSLLVGGYLVHASVEASLLRRREEFGVLRAFGATRGQVLRLILADAAILGLAGTAAGIPLGIAAARANLATVSATLEDLYRLNAIDRVEVGPGLLALAAAVGVLGALAGAALPAYDQSRCDPRALLAGYTLRESARRNTGGLAIAGGSFLALTGGCAWLLGRGRPWSGFAVAVGILVAVPLCAPGLLAGLGYLPRPARFSLAYGMRSLAARLRATSVPVGALAIAVSMLVALTIMVGSFRRTLEIWLTQTLRADVYVTTPSWRRGASEAALSPDVLEVLARVPGARSVDLQRQLFAHSGRRRISVTGFDAALPEAEGRFELISGDRGQAMRRLRQGAVLVSEPLARKAGLSVGDRIPIQTPAGEALFPVAGVSTEYGNESGSVFMDLGTLAAHFGPAPPGNAAIYLRPGVDPAAVIDRLKAALAGRPVEVRSNRRVRGRILAIFDETFAVTRLLEAMALLIALVGVTLSLLILARDRRAELALYRSLGATRAQLFANFVGRGLGMALLGLVLGAAGGVGLAWVLVFLVNRDTFGWTIALHWPWRTLVAEAIAILAAAGLASLHPALRASRSPAGELSRDAL